MQPASVTDVAPGPAIFPTLRDGAAQAAFERDGIVVLPLLSAAEARSLRAELLGVIPEDPGDFLDLFRNNPPQVRGEIDELVRARLEDRVAEVFVDHDFWSATVLVKPPGPGGEIGLHTDWNMVDESAYRSGLIWIALSDTDERSGGLDVVPGTNRMDIPFRGHQVHFDFDAPDVRAAIDARTVPLEVPIGHAAIWDNRLLHGSGPNTGSTWRIAAALGFKPRRAQLYHYRAAANGVPHRYQLDPRFFLEYEPFDPASHPAGPHVLGAEAVEVEPWTLRVEDLAQLEPSGPIFGTAPSGREPDRTPSPRADLRWLHLDATETPAHPDLLADIRRRATDGATIDGVFTEEQCAAAVESLSRDPQERHGAMFGTMLGMSLANLAQHTGDPHDRTAYFDDADLVRARLAEAFGGDPFARIAEVVGGAAGGRTFGAPFEGTRQYLAGNVRWMEPGGRALPAHVGNEFQQQTDGSTDDLRATTQIADHFSWFVVLQAPTEGGELAVFDLLYESHEPAEQWGIDGRDDRAFDEAPALLVPPRAGQLIIFGGGWRWHRVNRVGGTLPRVTLGGFAGPSFDGTQISSWF